MRSLFPRGIAAAGLGAAMACALAVGDPAPELAAAQEHIDHKDWTGALVELKGALRKNPRSAEAHTLMGLSYRKSGQIDAALDSYRTALRIAPDNREAHEHIGEAYLQVREPDKAREHLAALKRICGAAPCPEYGELAKAFAAVKEDPAPRARPRTARR